MSEEIKEYTLKFHKYYERLAPNYGYETRKDTKEFDFNSNNGKLMYATVSEIISPLLQKVEQLENIRKEAIKFLENEENIMDTYYKHDFRKYPDYDPFNAKDEEEVCCVELYGYNDLLNILNKGSEE